MKGFSAMEGRSKTISTRQSHVIYIIASFSKVRYIVAGGY